MKNRNFVCCKKGLMLSNTQISLIIIASALILVTLFYFKARTIFVGG